MLSFAVASRPAVRAVSLPYGASLIFCVVFLSLPTRISLAGAVNGGGTDGAVGDALGKGNREGPAARPGARRPKGRQLAWNPLLRPIKQLTLSAS